jgi:Uma2 family endonuclease
MRSEMVEVERRPITVEEFHRMGELGFFDEDQRLELIEGDLIVPPQMGPRHAGGIGRVNEYLINRLRGLATVRCQVPLPLLPVSEPSPDFAIARFDAGHYSSRHPSPDDILWVIELGDATRRFDRTVKFPMYAKHGIRETWLVDLVARRIIVGRDPAPLEYGTVLTFEPGTTLCPGALPAVPFEAAELLGRA